MDVKETDILGADIDQHWYYYAKARAMTQLLGKQTFKKILDVGAGSGFFSRHLLRHTDSTEAWCIDTSYKVDSNEKIANKSVYFRRSVNAIDADLVLLMDVLEHVDDDVALLREYVDKVANGTRFLITVPAFQFLWSGHDDFLEHKRRYTLSQLEGVIEKSGLKVKKRFYYFFVVFPIAASIRLIQKIKPKKNLPKSQLSKHNPIVNAIFKLLCVMELPFMRFNRTAGLTVFCLAEKMTEDEILNCMNINLTGKANSERT